MKRPLSIVLVMLVSVCAVYANDYALTGVTYAFESIQSTEYIKVEFNIGCTGSSSCGAVNYTIDLNGYDVEKRSDQIPQNGQLPIDYLTEAPYGDIELIIQIYPPSASDEIASNNLYAENFTHEEPNASSPLPQEATTILGAILTWKDNPSITEKLAIVVGEKAPQSDIDVANAVHKIFYPFDSAYNHRFFDMDITARPRVILIGGGCANNMVEGYFPNQGFGCRDWKLRPGQAVIKYGSSLAGDAILVAGTDAADTRKAIAEWQNYYYSYKFKYGDEAIIE